MPDNIPAFVLDSFAILSYFQAEAGGEFVRQLFESARDGKIVLHSSLVNVGEMYYLVGREKSKSQAEEMLKDLRELPVTLQAATEERILSAARIKSDNPIS